MNEIRTYQTRLALSSEQAALLDAYAALYGKAERSLFARLSAGESLSVLKREFIGGLGITARQFPCRCDPGTRTVLSTVRRTSWANGDKCPCFEARLSRFQGSRW